VTTLANLSKGVAWEYRMHRALFASGWYVRRNVDLRERIAGSPQTMSEIDLFGLSFDAGLAARRLVGECKDRKGSTKEADRVIWLLGLGQLLDADELLFAKPQIARRGDGALRRIDTSGFIRRSGSVEDRGCSRGVRVCRSLRPHHR
jgi:hypothetical protein